MKFVYVIAALVAFSGCATKGSVDAVNLRVDELAISQKALADRVSAVESNQKH